MPCPACGTAEVGLANDLGSSTPKACDHRRCRAECRARFIRPRIARRGMDSSNRLGRLRWVVERTLAWLNRFRRFAILYERRPDIHEAFVVLGCVLLRLNQIKRFC
jgi:transposase